MLKIVERIKKVKVITLLFIVGIVSFLTFAYYDIDQKREKAKAYLPINEIIVPRGSLVKNSEVNSIENLGKLNKIDLLFSRLESLDDSGLGEDAVARKIAFNELVRLCNVYPEKMLDIRQECSDDRKCEMIDKAFAKEVFCCISDDDGIIVKSDVESDRKLTKKEIADLNLVFQTVVFGYNSKYQKVNDINYIFSSYFDSPENIDLAKTIYYMSGDKGLTQVEIINLTKKYDIPCHMEADNSKCVKGYSRVREKEVDKLFVKYMATSFYSTNLVGESDTYHLSEQGAFYTTNRNSDKYKKGFFIVESGKVIDGNIELIGQSVDGKSKLVLERRFNDKYVIKSHKKM